MSKFFGGRLILMISIFGGDKPMGNNENTKCLDWMGMGMIGSFWRKDLRGLNGAKQMNGQMFLRGKIANILNKIVENNKKQN